MRCASRSPAARATRRRRITASPRSKPPARLPFDDGCRREADLFKELENSDEARALRYAFFIEREVARLPDIPVQHAGARLQPRRGGGRRHDGRRHRHELRRLRLAGEDHGCDAGGAGARHAAHPRQLCDVGPPRLAGRGRDAAPARAHRTGDGLRGHRRLRPGDRGGVRGDGRQEAGVRQAGRGDEAGRAAVLQHIGAGHRSACHDDQAAAGRGGDALLQPGQRDEAAGGGARQVVLAADAGNGDADGPQDRQDFGDGGQHRWFRRQPFARAVQHRDGDPARGRLPARAGRQGDGRLRLSDGAVRGRRSGRSRHRLCQPQAPRRGEPELPQAADLRSPGRDGAPRAEDRRGMVSLREGRSHAASRSRGCRHHQGGRRRSRQSRRGSSATRRSCTGCCSPR